MEKCLEESEKKKSTFNRKDYDFRKVEEKELAALLYNLENLFTFIKKQSKLFAHIIAYFFVVCGLSFAAYFFTEQIEALPIGFIVIGNTLVLLYGMWLLFLGVKQCFVNDNYLKILMKHINDVKKVLEKKDKTD
ncbi:hypothetical protein ABEX78_24065 [Priestia megaterium]